MSNKDTSDSTTDDQEHQPEEPVVKTEVVETEDYPTTEEVPEDDDNIDYEEPVEKVEEPKEQIDNVDVELHQHHAINELGYNIDKEVNHDKDFINLPSDFSDKIANMFLELSNKHLETSADLTKWAEVLGDGVRYTTTNEALNKSMDNPDTEWKQQVDVNGNKLLTRSLKNKKSSNSELSGERALLAIMNHLKIGSTTQVPLWHSGIWVTLITPKDKDLISLFREINDDKISLGRETNGLIYSNSSVIIAKRVLRFVIDHIKSTTCSLGSEDNLYDIIKVQDMYPLILGILTTMYPKGHQYRRGCSAGSEDCSHISEETIDLKLLTWTNNNALSDSHKAHMLRVTPGSTTIDDVRQYQDSLLQTNSSVVEVLSENNAEISFTLKSPTISEYIEDGESWVNEINELVKDVTDNEEGHRDVILERYSQTSILRQYNNWVKSITIDTNVIKDKESINKSLELLSSDDKLREALLTSVGKYIDNSTVSLVGIPSYDCPVCGKDQNNSESTNKDFVNIIPLDVLTVFFTLGELSALRIAAR